MGDIKPHRPVLLILAAFSRHAAALDWARQRAERAWGEVALASDIVDFAYTDYYQPTMGSGLQKILFAFRDTIDPQRLAEIKLQTNVWEDEYRDACSDSEVRPLNLDPGYLTSAKLVLATTKDRDHRIYLGRGIFAEVTLHFQRGRGWQPRDWTYADYRSAEYHAFFDRCRQYLREQRHAS